MRAVERQVQQMPHGAVRAVAADDERGGQLAALAVPVQRDAT